MHVLHVVAKQGAGGGFNLKLVNVVDKDFAAQHASGSLVGGNEQRSLAIASHGAGGGHDDAGRTRLVLAAAVKGRARVVATERHAVAIERRDRHNVAGQTPRKAAQTGGDLEGNARGRQGQQHSRH